MIPASPEMFGTPADGAPVTMAGSDSNLANENSIGGFGVAVGTAGGPIAATVTAGAGVGTGVAGANRDDPPCAHQDHTTVRRRKRPPPVRMTSRRRVRGGRGGRRDGRRYDGSLPMLRRLAASGAPPKGSGNAGRDPLRPLRGRGIGAGVSVLPAIGPKQSDQSRYLVRVRHVRSIDGHASRTPTPNATVRAMYITGSRTKSRATEARPDPASPR